MALLLTLTSVALLYILAQQSRVEVEIYSTAAAVSRDHVIAEYQARSIVNLSRLLLHSEPAIRRAMTPVLAPMMALMGRGLSVPQIPIWEQADLLLGAFRSQQGAADFSQAVGIDMGAARGLGGLTGASPAVIIDEDAKININGFDRSTAVARRIAQQVLGLVANPALDPFFQERDPDNQFTDRITLVQSVVDFADANTEAFDAQSLLSTTVSASGGGGAEDSFYSNLRPPYLRRNAPFDSIEELRMVRGFSSDDLWASIVDPDPGSPRRRTMTVWGQGLINVNTANAQTILALICAYAPQAVQCTDPSQASGFITGVTMIQAFTTSMGLPLFSNPRSFVDTIQGRPPMGPMLTQLGVQPFQLPDALAVERAATTESKVFSIYAEAAVGLAHVRIHTVVDMRAQPGIPAAFTAALAGVATRSQTAGTQVITTSTGAQATVSSAGGTVLYWRED